MYIMIEEYFDFKTQQPGNTAARKKVAEEPEVREERSFFFWLSYI